MKPTPLHPDDPVIVSPSDPAWPAAFAAERGRILGTITAASGWIEHMGSTAVPGLAAKPVLDLLIGLPSLADAGVWIAGLEALGYEYVPAFEDEMPDRRYFRRFELGVRLAQIHMVARGGEFWVRHLAFRDYLRAHPAEAAAYGALKVSLAERFRDDREGYMDGKDAFIKELESRALAWAALQ